MENRRERLKIFFNANPKIKKIIGVVLIIIGLLALLTPLTPGSWLAIIGLEFLGIRLSAWHKIKLWLKK